MSGQPARQPLMSGLVVAERLGGHHPADRVDDRDHVVVLVGVHPTDVGRRGRGVLPLLHASSCTQRDQCCGTAGRAEQ
jgi:hypothetical protein